MNKVILAHLRRAGDKRVGQRGAYNAMAHYNMLDRDASDAADRLRAMIETTYGDKAEQVKDQIRRQYDDEIEELADDAPIGAAINQLREIKEFYRARIADIKWGRFKLDDKPATVFDLVRQAIETRRKSFPAEDVAVWRGNHIRVMLHRYQGRLLLDARNGDPNAACRTVAGFYDPRAGGWTFQLSERDYNDWAAKVRRMDGAK